MSNKYLICFDESRMGGAYKMGPKPRTVQEDTACTGFSQSDTIYCTGCAQNCILREDVVTDIVGGALTEAPKAWLLIVKL